MKKPLAAAAIRRMPDYSRCLRDLLGNGILRVSSAELADRMHLSAPQVRQDLAGFPGCGIQGYGYSVKKLYQAVGAFLGISDEFSAVILGGHQAPYLARHPLFVRYGIRLRAVFCDLAEDEFPLPPSAKRFPLNGWAEFVRAERIPLLILCADPPDPDAFLQSAKEAGVRGILTLCDRPLSEPLCASYGIRVRNLSLSEELMLLCCALKQEENPT